MVFRTLLLFFFFLSVLWAEGQNVPFERYTSKNGLISDRITAIAQDDKGFIWFGSYFGICRYNGIAFDKIKLPAVQDSKYVTFLQGANGKMYAGFLFIGGLAEYDQGKIRSYFISGKDSAIANEFVCMADEGDGNILLCNSISQVFRFRNGHFTQIAQLEYRPPYSPKTIFIDRKKNIWIGTEKGLFVLSYPYKSYQSLYPEENIYSMVQTENGSILLLHGNARRTVLESCQGWNNGLVGDRQEVIGNKVRPISFADDHADAIWGLDVEKGLFRADESLKRSFYQVPLDLGNEISALFADREDNIWIANEPGVFKISKFGSKYYLFNEIAAGGGSMHRQNDSVIWASNERGLYCIRENKVTKANFVKSPPGYFNLLAIDQKQNLWLGSWDSGLWKAKPRADGRMVISDFSRFGKDRIKPHYMVEDADHNLWVGGVSGLYRIRNDTVREKIQPLNEAGNPVFIVSFAVDQKNQVIWLGDNASGIVKLAYTVSADGKYAYRVTARLGKKDGLFDTYIRSSFVDHRGDLWVGTRFGGIYRIRDTKTGYQVGNLNVQAGLSCKRVTSIAEGDSTAMWFASCDGIYRYDFHGGWQHYSTSEGILNAEVYDVIVGTDPNSIWSLSSQGVNKLELKSIKKVPPLVHIVAVNVMGKPDSAALLAKTPVLYSYDQNSIEFDFAGASFIDEKKMRYRYMLDGYDKHWSDPVAINSVNYASLPAGKYEFKVMASNANGEWSREAAKFSFEIVVPFYKRTWFYFMLVILFICIIYLVRMQRLQQKFLIEKLRFNIARDLHDDVGSTLGSINLLSKTATRKLSKPQPSEEILPIFEKIGQSAENTLEAMDDIVWAINPNKDKVQDLVIRMREFAIPLFEAKGIEFHFDMMVDNEQALPMNLRRNAFLIYKESVYNVLKHSDATEVSIRLRMNHHSFQLYVKDNGHGFDPSSPTRRNGLKNMTNRAEVVEGRIDFNSNECGTQVAFFAPVK